MPGRRAEGLANPVGGCGREASATTGQGNTPQSRSPLIGPG